jgi:hypothetical protein
MAKKIPLIDQIRRHCIRAAAHIEAPFVVTPEQQQAMLASLKATCDFERFFFVVDLRDFSLKHGYGISRWMGHPDDLSMETYLALQHPATLNVQAQYGNIIIAKATQGELPVGFMKGTFSTLQAIRHRDGTYLQIKRVSSAFQLNKKRQVIEYLNEFTIIGPYRGEPFEARTFNIPDQVLQDFKQYVRDGMYHFLPFTPRDIHILRLYAYVPKITEQQVGIELKPQSPLKPKTIQTYKERIQAKAEKYFQLPFGSFYEVVEFMKREFLM